MKEDRMDLTEFLLARIDEDEQVARDAAGWDKSGSARATGHWRPDGYSSVVDDDRRLVVFSDGTPPEPAQRDHIARHDPARVLAECEAKRRIVGRLTHAADLAWSGSYAVRDDARASLADLALPYADHPDYDPSWRP